MKSFILVAENESLILPTILSRTQMVKVPPLLPSAIEEALIERAKIDHERARQIASVSNGSYREAAQLLQHSGEDWQSLLREWLNAIMKNGPVAQVKWIEEMSRHGREKQKQFLRYFNHLLGQAIKMQVMQGANFPISDDERDFALRLNKMAGLEQQEAMIEEIDRASYYIERNANAKMLFHALTIRLYHIIADKSLILTI
jgi:DNA polymerase-3 subunit delta'